ncbi:MAG TPA: PP2C family protein-serine/threonine phosphatase [Terriglobia bacterium]|nr:PP2C family protein-serine/threonine phosphatase [Terriglobia bacterium]
MAIISTSPTLDDQLHSIKEVFADSLRDALSIQQSQVAEKLFEHSLEEAFNIQEAMLPAEPLRLPTVEVRCKFRPAKHVSGDFLDYFQLNNGLMGLYLGDVVGKGLPAALYGALAVGMLRGINKGGETPAAVLEALNRRLTDRHVLGRYCAVQYAVLDPISCRLNFSNAGLAPLPIRISAAGSQILGDGGFPCGIFKDVRYDVYAAQLTRGDTVLFSTDGLTEAHNYAEEEFGIERLVAACEESQHEPPEVLLERLFLAVDGFAAGAPQHDDMTAAALRLD